MGSGVGKVTSDTQIRKVLDCGPENTASTSSTSQGLKRFPGAQQDFVPPNAVAETGEASLAQRVLYLESLVQQQALQLQQMTKVMEGVQKDVRRTVSVMQYNILASYLGKNTQPWFLYGANITAEERENIFAKFHERGPDGAPKHSWPAYAEGVLSAEDIAEVDRYDVFFRWEFRRQKLLEQIEIMDPDVLSLVELDDHAYFAECLCDEWDSVFRKRPRASSADGCGIFWRRSKFELLASEGFDMVDGSDDKGREKRDRSCVMVLLKWRVAGPHILPLVVVSTHLAKDPYNKAQTAIRVRQVTQIMASLTEFTSKHNARHCPVVLLGDLNARHFGEIRGIARTVWQIKGEPIHKFLWGATDVNTGPTSVTKARHCRIDVVQYLSSHMEVQDVMPVPKLEPGEVIPNEDHPSDHFPVYVTFVLKDSYEKHRDCARAWLECVAGREKVHPLTDEELIDAFEFFDRDRQECIHRRDLEEACLDLRCNFSVDVPKLLVDCFPNKQITFQNFLRAYEASLGSDRLRAVGDLECAFRYFAGEKESIEIDTLEAAFREITPISFSDDEVKDMIGRVTQDGSPHGKASVHLKDFCEVVCRATFPNRQAVVTVTGTESRTFGPRTSTKEISTRLNMLHKKVSGHALRDPDRSISKGSVVSEMPMRIEKHLAPPLMH